MGSAIAQAAARFAGHFLGLGPEADLVRAYWQEQEEPALPEVPPLNGTVLSSLCVGLGDTLMLTDVPRASKGTVTSFSASKHFRALMKFNPWWVEPRVEEQLMLVNAPTLVRHYASGNGHYLQRLQRAYGLQAAMVPRGCVAWKGRRANNRVLMHFESGPHALWQRKHISPTARMLSAQSRAVLEQWMAGAHGLEFWLVGKPPEGGLRGAQHKRTPTISDLVEVTGQCGWFLGIVSGVMHLATAMQLRCIVLCDFPHAHQIMLPTLKHTEQVESEWLYPQNCHLHQTEDGPLVKRLSVDNLKRALEGGVYPYWRTDYCDLVEETL